MPNINRAPVVLFKGDKRWAAHYLNENYREWKKHHIAKEEILLRKRTNSKLNQIETLSEPLPAPFRSNLPAIPETRFDALLEAYRAFQTAKNAIVYDPDKVQALGMVFCEYYLALKPLICDFCFIPDEEFDYATYHKAMPIIELKVGSQKMDTESIKASDFPCPQCNAPSGVHCGETKVCGKLTKYVHAPRMKLALLARMEKIDNDRSTSKATS